MMTFSSTQGLGRALLTHAFLCLTLALSPVANAGPAEDGQWSGVIQWPHIPVSAANLPDGRVVTWASNERTRFPSNPPLESTYTSLWDPDTNQFDEIFRTGHDMFCAHLSMLEDGRLLVNGGNSAGRVTTSLFDFRTDEWTKVEDMNRRRWYNTTVAMPDGEVFTMIGTNGGPYPEVWRENEGWSFKNGINFSSPILNYSGHYEQLWWPLIHVAPNGKIFHSGPTPKMHWIDLENEGSLVEAAPTNNGWYPKHGTTVMYDEGKIITAGGATAGGNQRSTNRSMVIDLNGTAPQVREITPMKYSRKFQNGVMLPNGEMLVLGGNSSGAKFSDNGSIYPVETWNPETETWREGAPSSKPRNYHSIALLLNDGRVLSAGGGLCGCSADHQNGQIYSPSYLFNTDGSLATRPTINAAPESIDVGTNFDVKATADMQKFSLIKLSSTTHGMNTDLRFLNLPFTETSAGQYQVTAHTNHNVLTPGYWMMFALNSQGTPSVAKVIKVNIKPGLTPTPNLAYEYFEGNWNTLPNFDNLSATKTGNLRSFSLSPRLVNEYFGFRFTGNLKITTSGNYTFNTTSDDGSQLFIDGNLVVDNDGLHASQKRSGSINLTEGIHEIVVTFFEKTGGEVLDVTYSGPGFSEKTIPESALVTNTNFILTEPITAQTSVNGSTASYSLDTNGANGVVTYHWNFGDGSAPVVVNGTSSVDHIFPDAGRYIVSVRAVDENGNEITTSFYQAIHKPLSTGSISASSTILLDEARNFVWNVNPDNKTISVFNSQNNTKVREISVSGFPHSIAQASDGTIWVTHSENAGITMINPQNFNTSGLSLKENSRPYGIVFDKSENRAFVTLEASGELLEIDGASRTIDSTTDLGYTPRHLSYSSDQKVILVSRFITPPLPFESTNTPETALAGAEIIAVDADTMSITDTIILQHSDRADSEHSGRGIPNYLNAAVISPDGLSAWVPSKQDNIMRGTARDGQELAHDLTVRAVASKVDLGSLSEFTNNRVDIDNASMANGAIYDQFGNYLFIALEGNRQISVIDPHSNAEIFRFDTGRAPQSLALSADGLTLFVHNFMDRTVSVHDISDLIEKGQLNVTQVAVMNSVNSESLTSNVLAGKQLFHDAKDTRLASQEYMSCASCHNEGGDDGRVWDFTQFGEGLRNSISLRGHAEAQGRLHWSANFDEIHDFEGQIRNFAGGTGLMSDADFNTGTRSDPLGDKKAGISADLDNLAAYVNSLTKFGESPNRQASAISADATAGKTIFDDNNCASCHSGEKFTDSESGALHDIGTINGDAGLSNGVDTPTLAGLWATAPYLHDGSAATLKDAVSAHDGVSLSAQELNQLEAYLKTIDDTDKNLPPVPSNTAPTIGISSPVNNATGTEGDSISFVATASDQEEGDISNGINWSSNIDGALNIGGSFSTTTLSVGVHTITAVVTDSGSLSASVSIQVTINEETTGGAVNDLIVDNTDANTSQIGTWPQSSGTPTHDGSNSFYRVGNGSFRWIPNVITQGEYEVYAWWTYHYNRNPEATYNINHSSGSDQQIRAQNDSSLGGQWNLLGTYTFNTGNTGFVEVDSVNTGRSTSVDAIKLVYVGDGTPPSENTVPTIAISTPADDSVVTEGASLTFTASANDEEDGNISNSINWSSNIDGALSIGDSFSTTTLSVGVHNITASVTDSDSLSANSSVQITVNEDASGGTVSDIIVDNTDLNTSKVGSWPQSSGTPTHDGSNSFYRVGDGSFRWIPEVTTSGEYEVYAWWTYHYNRNPEAAFTINHANGSSQEVRAQNDSALGGRWVLLGSYDFNTGSNGYVEVASVDTGRSTSVDAIKLVYVSGGTPPTNNAPTITINTPLNNASSNAGELVTFSATASDAEEGDLSSTINWRSSIDGGPVTAASVSVSTLSVGTHTITATVTDSGNLTSSTTITFTILSN